VKVSNSIFDIESGMKIEKNTCWIFDCRGHGRDNIWGEHEYTQMWEKVTWSMESTEQWNLLLLLPAGEDSNKILEFLQVPQDRTQVFHMSYVFGTQCKEKGQELKVQGRVITKLKAVRPILIILCHPASLTPEGNIAHGHLAIDHVYTEPDSWDICKMYKEARSPQCIDDLIKPFYEPHSWTIAAQGYSHMIDTLAGKTQQLILLESDPSMVIWLQEWKRQVIDKEEDSTFELWEEDCQAQEENDEVQVRGTTL
jgi:hypothetical protein